MCAPGREQIALLKLVKRGQVSEAVLCPRLGETANSNRWAASGVLCVYFRAYGGDVLSLLLCLQLYSVSVTLLPKR